MKILILSAYDADSHKRWHQGLVANFPEHEFTVLTLPPRYFSWRIRGNAFSWAFAERELLLSEQWDLVVATSMVDLATLKGLVPEIAAVPSALYFHENQFAYPKGHQAHKSIEPQVVSLYAAVAADALVFNSDFNRRTFLGGVADLLNKLPDQVPAGVPQLLEEKSRVIPVPLEGWCFELARNQSTSSSSVQASSRTLTVIWNHRWEYDKGPATLLAVIRELRKKKPGLAMRWHIVGQQFRRVPPEFEQIRAELAEAGWLGRCGFLPFEDYREALAEADVALSTAEHDFQGLAVMDAVAAGCIPVLPNAVAYPNFFCSEHLYPAGDAHQCAALILRSSTMSPPAIDHLAWLAVVGDYRALFRGLDGHRSVNK